MTIGEIENSMTTVEFREWIAFSRIEPIGEDRADSRIGMLSSLLHNVGVSLITAIVKSSGGRMSAATRSGKPAKATDYMPFRESHLTKEEIKEREKKKAADTLRGMF